MEARLAGAADFSPRLDQGVEFRSQGDPVFVSYQSRGVSENAPARITRFTEETE